jgi:hypothetical protein
MKPGKGDGGEDEKETVGRESGGVESVGVQERLKELKMSKDVWIVSRVGKLGVKFDPPRKDNPLDTKKLELYEHRITLTHVCHMYTDIVNVSYNVLYGSGIQYTYLY